LKTDPLQLCIQIPKKFLKIKKSQIQKVEPVTIKQFFRATANKFGQKVPKLQLKAAYNSPSQELEEGAHSAPYLIVW
jgi:hypothetical protein